MQFTVTDGSGFLAIVDPDSYQGFVAEDWTYESLLDHFAQEMRRRSLLVWATSEHGGTWTVTTDAPSRTGRSVTGTIVSTGGRLCLTDYESLTMAAQFPDVTLPEPHMADLVFEVPAGTLACTVTRYHDDDSMPPPHVALTLSPAGATIEAWPRPAWHPPTDA